MTQPILTSFYSRPETTKVVTTNKPIRSITRTLNSVYGTQKCKKDFDCGKNMECLAEICYCYDGFYPENNHCVDISRIENKTINSKSTRKIFGFNTCSSKPCQNNGFCERLNSIEYFCHCPLGFAGINCEISYERFLFPSFTKKSFLELSYQFDLFDFSIELEFKSNSLNGIILFTSQFRDGSGDFLLLALRHGLIEMRINGARELPAKFTLPNSIEIGKFHRLFIKKKENLLILQLDDNVPYLDQIFHKSFVLSNNIILGRFTSLPGFSDRILQKLEVYDSFEGCVQYLQLNDKVFNIAFPSKDIFNGLNVMECPANYCINEKCSQNGRCRLNGTSHECVCQKEFHGKWCQLKKNGCLKSPCKHPSSTCIPTSTGSFQCVCPQDYDGIFCEKKSEIKAHFTGRFNGNSYIERSGLKHLDLIDIVFMSNSSNGVLLYNYDVYNDNYLGIKIKNGYIVFEMKIFNKFDRLISRNPIDSSKTWHQIRITRKNKRFEMFFNDDDEVISSEIYDKLRFGISGPLTIGGVEEGSKVNRKFKMIQGLKGAIQKILINDNVQADIRLNSILLCNIDMFEGFPCDHVYCLNGGVCQPLKNNFKCNLYL